MLRSALKHKVKLPPTKLEPKTRMDMPIWYHTGLVGMKRPGFNTATGKCQRRNHRVKTVGDLLTLVKQTNRNINKLHKPRKNCKCDSCQKMREEGCKNSHKCGESARRLLNSLGGEWNPLTIENLSNKQIGEGIRYLLDNEDSILFNKALHVDTSLKETFRVFANEETETMNKSNTSGSPQQVAGSPRPKIGPAQWIRAYMDGSCENNGYENAKAGAGIWYGDGDPRNTAIKVPPHLKQSNNAGEALAILITTSQTDEDDHLEILSDSKITIEGLTKHLTEWEDKGWVGIENKEILQAIAAKMRSRKGQTILTKVKGHSGLIGNDRADELAKEGAKMNNENQMNINPPRGNYALGMKLSTATQALLYKGILGGKPPPLRGEVRQSTWTESGGQ